MSNRCSAIHPTLNIQCERTTPGSCEVNHMFMDENGCYEFWPNSVEILDLYFREWAELKKKYIELSESKKFLPEQKKLF